MAKRSIVSLVAAGRPDRDDSEPSRTLIEHAYAQLRDDIIEGHLAPGEKLRVEHLKSRYAVGAGTLREAITRLASDALVEAEGQRGFRVAPITIEDLEDITRLRLHIEIEALRVSIRHGDAAWRAQLTQAWEELSSTEQPMRSESRRRWEMLNTRFHEALLAGQTSPWTLKVLRLLARHTERYRRYAMELPRTGRDVHAEHQRIYEMAMDGQEASAALALEVHIRMTPDLIRRAWQEGRLNPDLSPTASAKGLAS